MNCENFKDELVALLYEDEVSSPELQIHLAQCADCESTLQSFQSTQALFYRNLPDVYPPAHLNEKVLKLVEPKISLFKRISAAFLHPALVGLTVFTITLGGALYFKNELPTLRLGSQQTHEAFGPAGSFSVQNSPAVKNAFLNYRMADWNTALSVIPDLERPVLRHVDVAGIEQSTIEAVASFQHQIALRHLIDKDYARAEQVLNQLITQHLDYSHWGQAVVQHMNLMKSMGRMDQVSHDLSYLKEYAQASPELIAQAEELAGNVD